MKVHNFTSPLISVEWLSKYIVSPNLIILDATINKVVNSNSIRIPSARFFDIRKKFSDVSAPFPSTLPSTSQFTNEARKLGINNDSFIVVYDDKGIYSSARAWWLFKAFGFNNVAVLDGGLPEWKVKGFAIEVYNNETYTIGDFEANFNPKLMTDFEGVNLSSKDDKTLILDARSRGRFNCTEPEPRVGLRSGAIPNSKNLPYTSLFNGYKLKSKDQLSMIFNDLVEHKTRLVFSCGSGVTACILALAATLCDFMNLVVYDGSWTEYVTLTTNLQSK